MTKHSRSDNVRLLGSCSLARVPVEENAMNRVITIVKAIIVNKATVVILPLLYVSHISTNVGCPICGGRGMHPWEYGRFFAS